MADRLRLMIRTPHEVVFDDHVDSVRLPTSTGQVGIRPRQEPMVTVVDPGLVIVRTGGRLRFAATAGGLLDNGREQSVLYTPFAVLGEEATEVLAALDRELAAPDNELSIRRRLSELEQRIVQELRDHSMIRPMGVDDGS